MMISGLVKWMWGFVVSDDEPKKQIKRMSDKEAVSVIEEFYLNYKTNSRKLKKANYLMNRDIDSIKKSVITYENLLNNNPSKSSRKKKKYKY
tara:strand:+ start:29 stop:304 length:276 start_codon:yes stop_codon:yes gene_type:complete